MGIAGRAAGIDGLAAGTVDIVGSSGGPNLRTVPTGIAGGLGEVILVVVCAIAGVGSGTFINPVGIVCIAEVSAIF